MEKSRKLEVMRAAYAELEAIDLAFLQKAQDSLIDAFPEDVSRREACLDRLRAALSTLTPELGEEALERIRLWHQKALARNSRIMEVIGALRDRARAESVCAGGVANTPYMKRVSANKFVY